MSDGPNESRDARPGDVLVAVPADMFAELRRAAGARGDVRRKLVEILEDWIDLRESDKVVKRLRAGTEKTYSHEQIKRELGL